MTLTRRNLVASAGAAVLAVPFLSSITQAEDTAALPTGLKVSVAVNSPWMVNQVSLTSDGLMFLGLPRYPDHEDTPCVAKKVADGTLAPFPGNEWNAWKHGDDGLNAFVYVNSLHIFADDTVWCVDQGRLRPEATPADMVPPKPGAQKLVQLDPVSGNILQIIRFGEDILPPGAQLNDLRIYGSYIYLTDSGLGALIVHDQSTGTTTRRLSGSPVTQEIPVAVAPPPPGQPPAKHRIPKSDMIELSPDGEWLYWASPTGPFRRVKTAQLRDGALSDAELTQHVEVVAQVELTGGSAMDSLGNLYLSEIRTKAVTVLAPDGKKALLAADAAFEGPDGSFIDKDRRLYIPVSQAGRTRLFGNLTDLTVKPFKVFCVELPETLDGIGLGNTITRHA